MENVRSFTGRALFNPYALDFLHPTGFNKCSIEHRDSVIAALRDSTINPYMNPRNTSYWSLLSRLHLLAPLQIVYSSAVTLTASRLGVVVNGLLTVGSFVKSYLADLRNQKHELEKTREYAFAFFTDLFCAVAGTYLTKAMIEHTVCALHFARVTSFMGKCYLKPIPSAFSFALSMTVAIVSALAFFSIQQPNIAPSLFVEDKYRVGMYLSLFLRKHLGLVSANKGPLHFSTQDKLAELSPECPNWKTLLYAVFNAELELIEAVNKCNQALTDDKKIQFTYPFNGNNIADQLETQLTQNAGLQLIASAAHANLLLIITQLRALQIRIEYSRKMFEEAQKLTVEDGILLAWFKAAMKEPSNKFIPSKDPSYIEQADYTRLFFSFAQGTNPSEGNFLWEQVNINPVNPDSPPISQNATLFEKFKDAVARNKFCAMNNMPDRIQSSLKIFGLTNTTPHEAFAAIRKEYVLALHPDKHPGKDAAALSEVEELSKCALTLLRLIKERNLKNND